MSFRRITFSTKPPVHLDLPLGARAAAVEAQPLGEAVNGVAQAHARALPRVVGGELVHRVFVGCVVLLVRSGVEDSEAPSCTAAASVEHPGEVRVLLPLL